MFKYFTVKNTYRYVDVLEDMVDSYNDSYHRTIKMTPRDVDEDNVLRVYRNARASIFSRRAAPKCRVGDYVRISKYVQRRLREGIRE